MSRYRHALPQLKGGFFLTDAGLETSLIFHEGLELPLFASFPLLRDPQGFAAMRRHLADYAKLAQRHGAGLVMETPTWRANADWGAQLGYDAAALAEANRAAVALLEAIRAEFEPELPLVISGCLGPRGDAYFPKDRMTEAEAQAYHRPQIETLAATNADMISAFTLNYPEEAIGVVTASREARMPVMISFTVETDGTLPTGQPLGAAIEQVDEATGGYAAYYMINCAHPSHFGPMLDLAGQHGEPWLGRLRALRSNSSRMSHRELNESAEIDTGNPEELGRETLDLLQRFPQLNILGGCCGTDHRHVEQIATACGPVFARRQSA